MKKYIGPFLLMIFMALLTFLRDDYQHLGLLLLLSLEALVSLSLWSFYASRGNTPTQLLCLSLASGAVISLLICILYENIHIADSIAACVSSAVLCLSYGVMEVYLRTKSWVPADGIYQGRTEHKRKPGIMQAQFSYLHENKKYTGIPQDLEMFNSENYDMGKPCQVFVNVNTPNQFRLQKPSLKFMDFAFFGFGVLLIYLISRLYLA